MSGVDREFRGLELSRLGTPACQIALQKQLAQLLEREEVEERDIALAEAFALIHRGEEDPFIVLGPLELRGVVTIECLTRLWELVWRSDPLLFRIGNMVAEELYRYVFHGQDEALTDDIRAVIIKRMAHLVALSSFVQDYHSILKSLDAVSYYESFRLLAEEKFELVVNFPQPSPLVVSKVEVLTLLLHQITAPQNEFYEASMDGQSSVGWSG